MWFFPGFGIRPGRKVMWSKVLQVLWTRGSNKYIEYINKSGCDVGVVGVRHGVTCVCVMVRDVQCISVLEEI